MDIGFGDVVFPAASEVTYPTILEFPAPVLRGYSIESVVAEKFQAMVKLGVLNSRMKDFYDIWALSQTQNFGGATLVTAIKRTFDARGTTLSSHPTVLQNAFAVNKDREAQWRAFINRSDIRESPQAFAEVVASIEAFLRPIVTAALEDTADIMVWKGPGPWRQHS